MNLEQTIGWSVALAFVSVATIVSNSITIFIFTQREFKRKQSYNLPMNLAVTDLLVGLVALPLYILLYNLPSSEYSYIIGRVYQTVDITVGLVSISSISIIALERLYAIGWPLKQRVLQRKHYITSLAFTWLYGITLMVIVLYILHDNAREKGVLKTYVVMCSIAIPLIITVIAYFLLYILKVKSQRNLQVNADERRNKKLAGTLFIVTVVFFLTWTPFTILSFVITYFSIPPNVLEVTKFLHYSNSFANCIIYTLRSPSFLAAFRKIFKRRRAVGREVPRPVGGVQPATSETELRSRGLGASTATLVSLAQTS